MSHSKQWPLPQTLTLLTALAAARKHFTCVPVST